MTAPWSVEVSRGGHVESRHLGHGVVMTVSGEIMLAFGQIDRPTFPRSAAKWVQGLPLVASGAADHFQLSTEELAIACASHNGEPDHCQTVLHWLTRLGLSEADLECGLSWPFTEPLRLQAAARGETPRAITHCCSGKHAGMLSVCVHKGWPTVGYTDRDHPLQRQIADVMTHLFGAVVETAPCGIDGCSVPTYALPLRTLAHGFARLGAGALDAPWADAAQRLLRAQVSAPWMVAGTGRIDTALLLAGQGRLQVKMGAEGVYCGALPDRGLGFALKCEDGALRGSEALIVALLDAIGEHPLISALPDAMRQPVVRSAHGTVVGDLRVSFPETW
jgi:L-asparaginase II